MCLFYSFLALTFYTGFAPTGDAHFCLFFTINTRATFDFAAVPRQLFFGFIAIAGLTQLVTQAGFLYGTHAKATGAKDAPDGTSDGAGLQYLTCQIV
jgi:hypothetical protein